MAADLRRQRVWLIALFVLLAAVVYWNVFRPAPPAAPAGRRAAQQAPARPPAGGGQPQTIEDVDVEALDQPRPEPAEGERNLFRYGQRQPPPSQSAGGGGAERPAPPPGEVEPGPVAGPSGPPPIPLRFVGLVERTRAKRKIAIFTDGRNTFYGGEGDIIEGRYRILQIGTESVELAYVDGTGQQRLRLAGL